MSGHLLSLGHEVKVFDNFTSGTMGHIEDHLTNPHFELIKGDIKDLASSDTIITISILFGILNALIALPGVLIYFKHRKV